MNKKGFTLIELLVVVLIIGILAAIALPQYFKAVEKSRSAEALSIMGSLGAAMERARLVSTDNTFPTSVQGLDLTFPTQTGSDATGSTWTTRNFTITVSGSAENAGVVTATRLGTNGYVLCRCYKSGRTGCTDAAASPGLCASLGYTTAGCVC